MSAEGMPQEDRSWLAETLTSLTRLVLRFPATTLVLAGLMAVAATYLSGTRLKFHTSRLDLLNPKSDFNRRWIHYIQEFGDAEDVVVVLEGQNRGAIDPVAREIAAALEAEPEHFRDVLYEIDCSKLRQKGLYYLDPDRLQEAVRGLDYYLDNVAPVLRGDWSLLQLGNLDPRALMQFQQLSGNNAAAQAAAQTHLSWFSRCLSQALQGEYQSPWMDMNFLRSDKNSPLCDPSGKTPTFSQRLVESEQLGIIILRLAKEDDRADFVRNAAGIERLREIVRDFQDRQSGVKIGLTGLPIIEYDEMNSSKVSMAEVSVVALLGVSLLFVVGFGGWRHPLLAVISLSLGTYWAMGYIALAIGHLNILSSAFAVILIGQGVDFSMYYVAEYLKQRERIASSRAALLRAVRRVGPGIFIGAVATAVAFFMAGLTEFTGVAELGVIAGGGILLCWLAGATILPASIHLADSRWPLRHVPAPVDVTNWMQSLLAKPLSLLTIALAGTVLLGFGLTQLRYDYNLLHMQARGLESVNLEKKLAAEDDLSASYALSMADSRRQVLDRAAQFLAKPSVKRVREIVSLLPPEADLPRKLPLIARLHRRLETLPDRVPAIPVTPQENLQRLLHQLRQFLAAQPNLRQFQGDFEQIAARLDRMTPAEYHARVSAYQQRLARDLLVNLQTLRAATGAAPPNLADLPAGLVSRFVSPGGKFLMKIYSRGDVWDMTAMEQFVHEVRQVDTNATGNPLQIYEASLQMKRSYEQAALLALTVILPVVYFDFRSLRALALAMLPLGLGMVQMFGLMGLLGLPLNAANMIVLPLILGVGIDAGVHIVHDFRSQRGPYRMNSAIASAVVINQVTNMAGFGALMIASHQGLQSLGRVLVLGMSSCLFSSLVILPALLTWLTRNRRAAPEEIPGKTWEPDPSALVPLSRLDPAHRPPSRRPSMIQVPSGARSPRPH
ncbi:MAG: MMPL family transporter [Pirellulales bacterium]|nr:MMPL family transporter [Pirellulales bacterium]